MAKNKHHKAPSESDGVYVLKLVLYLILGAQWLWFQHPDGSRFGVPVGLLIGFIFAAHDHFRVDRKVEYALLLVAALAGFAAQIGLLVSL
jgi:hypothetical protein